MARLRIRAITAAAAVLAVLAVAGCGSLPSEAIDPATDTHTFWHDQAGWARVGLALHQETNGTLTLALVVRNDSGRIQSLPALEAGSVVFYLDGVALAAAPPPAQPETPEARRTVMLAGGEHAAYTSATPKPLEPGGIHRLYAVVRGQDAYGREVLLQSPVIAVNTRPEVIDRFSFAETP